MSATYKGPAVLCFVPSGEWFHGRFIATSLNIERLAGVAVDTPHNTFMTYNESSKLWQCSLMGTETKEVCECMLPVDGSIRYYNVKVIDHASETDQTPPKALVCCSGGTMARFVSDDPDRIFTFEPTTSLVSEEAQASMSLLFPEIFRRASKQEKLDCVICFGQMEMDQSMHPEAQHK